jgi:hypothetical protein
MDNWKYVKMVEGVPFVGVYDGCEEVKKNFDGKESVATRYRFKEKDFVWFLDSGSKRLAKKMAGVKEGDELSITRTGSGVETDYSVESNEF